MRTSRRLLAVLTVLVAGVGLLLVPSAAAERSGRPHARTASRAVVHGRVTAASQGRSTSFETFSERSRPGAALPEADGAPERPGAEPRHRVRRHGRPRRVQPLGHDGRPRRRLLRRGGEQQHRGVQPQRDDGGRADHAQLVVGRPVDPALRPEGRLRPVHGHVRDRVAGPGRRAAAPRRSTCSRSRTRRPPPRARGAGRPSQATRSPRRPPLWADYPTLGYNDSRITISTNQFTFPSSTASFRYSQVMTIDKSVYDCIAADPHADGLRRDEDA